MLRPLRLIAWASLLATLGVTSPADAANRTVAVTAILEHPALDAIRRGLEDELRAAGDVEGERIEIVFESAKGSRAAAARIAERFVALAPDVIVPISTPSAQAVVAADAGIPVVFSGVTDPVGAKLVGSLEHPGGNVTGISDLAPVGAHLDLVKEVLPTARRLGVVLNPEEPNALSLLHLVEAAAPARGLDVVTAEATGRDEVAAAAARLAGAVDAVYVPTDNTVAAALDAVVRAGNAAGLPVFAADVNAVPRGAVAALGFNYYDLGRQTGRLVVRVLEGEAPGDIPVQSVRTTELFLNPSAAEAVGIDLPEALMARATSVVPSAWPVPRGAPKDEAAVPAEDSAP